MVSSLCTLFPNILPCIVFPSATFTRDTNISTSSGSTMVKIPLSTKNSDITRLVGLAFATRHPSLEIAPCPRFDLIPITMHSSLEKLPLGRMSASWFLVSTYLIWILGSKLILSNNQSRATLWVLDTCRIVGLRPLFIIVLKNVQQREKTEKLRGRQDMINIARRAGLDSWFGLVAFPLFLHREFFNFLFLRSLHSSQFVHTSNLCISKSFLFSQQFLLQSGLFSTRFDKFVLYVL